MPNVTDTPKTVAAWIAGYGDAFSRKGDSLTHRRVQEISHAATALKQRIGHLIGSDHVPQEFKAALSAVDALL